jgi:hypothetical protein
MAAPLEITPSQSLDTTNNVLEIIELRSPNIQDNLA